MAGGNAQFSQQAEQEPAIPPPALTGKVRLLSANQAADEAFRQQWRALSHDASTPNPFCEDWFVLPALTHLSTQQAARHHERIDRAGSVRKGLLAHFTGERLTGVLPLSYQRSYYGHPIPHFSTWLHPNAFCGAPLVAKGCEHGFWRDVLTLLDAPQKVMSGRSAMFVHLPQIPADTALCAALTEVAAEQTRAFTLPMSQQRAMLSSPLDPENYLQEAMSRKHRKELRRRRNRLEEQGSLTVERRTDAAGAAQWAEEFLSLEAAGWKGKEGSALASALPTRAFFAETMLGAAQAGRLERLALRIDGRAVAMLANFITPPASFAFKTTFDEAMAHYSPGMLLQVENLDLLKHADLEYSDSCAAPDHPMIERIWRQRRTMNAYNIAIGGPLRRLGFRALSAFENRKERSA